MSDTATVRLHKALAPLKTSIPHDGANCHYNLGKTLNSIRTKFLESLSDTERSLTEAMIPPLDFEIPRSLNAGVYTVPAMEARRLYAQLDAMLLPPRPLPVEAVSRVSPNANDRRVFIVHGHDEGTKELVARFLDKLAYEPIILHEQPTGGKTIIEKLEAYATVPFAIVLLTPDDEGRKVKVGELQKRARQNVVLELGYFLGRLGRRNVCALHKGGIEIPSDYLGVLFIPLDDSGGWRVVLAREMIAAGLAVDMNRVLK